MAPSVVIETPVPSATTAEKGAAIKDSTANRLSGPLKYSGSLDQFKSRDVTPVIGREFLEAQLTDILNDDAKVRDLALIGKSNRQ